MQESLCRETERLFYPDCSWDCLKNNFTTVILHFDFSGPFIRVSWFFKIFCFCMYYSGKLSQTRKSLLNRHWEMKQGGSITPVVQVGEVRHGEKLLTTCPHFFITSVTDHKRKRRPPLSPLFYPIAMLYFSGVFSRCIPSCTAQVQPVAVSVRMAQPLRIPNNLCLRITALSSKQCWNKSCSGGYDS